MSVDEIDETISVLDHSMGNLIEKIEKLSSDLRYMYDVRKTYIKRKEELLNEKNLQESDQRD